jgi:hypothetical protein
MSSQYPPPPQQQNPYGSDPKATAKAAKAYAKASRPWYKKKRWIALIAVVLIIIIAVAAGGGGSSDDSSGDDKGKDATNSQSGDGKAPTSAPEKAAPDNSSKGKGAITWGNWEVVGRLQVTKEEFSGDYAVVTRVKNTGDDADTGLFTVTILKGTEILGTADCSTAETDPGNTVTANCISTDKFNGDYTEVTIDDSF